MSTAGELWDKYHPLLLSKVSEGTARAYTYAWRKRVAPSFAHREIASITTLDIEVEFVAWSGSFSTRIDALSAFSALCRIAVKGAMIPTNPCVGVERPRTQAPDPTGRALTLDEVDILLSVLPSAGPYRRFVLAMLYTGCRLGEIAGLRGSDIDWEARTIKIERTASPGLTGQLVVGPTKGRRGRSVPLPSPLVPIIQEATAGHEPYDLVFPGPRGGYLSSKNLSRALDWFAVRDSIKTFPPGERPLHWHDLRHTASVMLFRAGLSVPDAMAILGHASMAVTQRYADTRQDAAKRGTVALSALYAPKSMGQVEGGDEAVKTASDLEI